MIECDAILPDCITSLLGSEAQWLAPILSAGAELQWKGPPIHFYPSVGRVRATDRSLINSVKTRRHHITNSAAAQASRPIHADICLCCVPNIVKWFSFIYATSILNKNIKWNSRWVRVLWKSEKLELSDCDFKDFVWSFNWILRMCNC